MGNCMSSTAVEAPLNPAPHPDARRVWLVSTPIDPRSIPADLVGVDASGLKAAMRNRGLEIEHWALKVDPAPGQKTDPTIVDITVQADHKLVSQLHPTSSPYWSGITRRMAVGWTIWNDHEVLVASKQLISARPKYDGRGNNFMQLARMLARHIEFVPVTVQGAGETDAAGTVGTDAGGEGLLMPGNRSQMTLVSGGTQSQRSQSLESSDAKNDLKAVRENNAVPARIPASSRQSQRMSIARPPLIQLSTAPSEVGSMLAPRPALHRAAESEGLTPSPAGSVRMSLPPQSRQQTSFSSPLNPQRQSIGDLRVDTNSLRARTNSDAANAYATTRIRASRRRSEAPSEWTSDVAADQRFRSVGSRSSLHPANRDSMLSLNTNFISSPSMWLPPPPPPPHTASHLPMMPFHPQLSMPGFPSMMFTPQQMFYPPPHPQMPLLVPPSPGFASHTSSAVNTPPESPALVGKGLMAMPHELRSNLA